MAFRIITRCAKGHQRRLFKNPHDGLHIARCVECDEELEDVFQWLNKHKAALPQNERKAKLKDFILNALNAEAQRQG